MVSDVNLHPYIKTLAFYRGNCTTDPAYTWYLEKVEEAVARAKAATGASQVDLIAHSAGGWLARAYIGGFLDGEANTVEPNPNVRHLVSLGSPHLPPPEGSADATRGALKFVNEEWPGAFFAESGVRYTCITVGRRNCMTECV